MERLVKFEVLGQEYPFYTDAPEEEVKEILQLVKSQLEQDTYSGKHVLPASKLAILASLNMAGKYVKLKKEFELYKKRIDKQIESLTQKIENSL